MHIITLILIFATLIALITGIVIMAKGGKINQKYSNKLMIARVTLQFLAIVTLGFMYFLVKK